MTKTQLIQAVIAKYPHISKADVTSVLEALPGIAIQELKNNGAVVIPGFVKLKAVTKKATPAREGIDPFTKQPKTFAAKPETKKVKASPVGDVKAALA